MDHPLINEGLSDLRRRVIQLIRAAYSVRRSSNIVFVCGGNEALHMRTQFRSYCEALPADYEIFFPEFALPNYFAGVVDEPFDIADFEQLIGEMSHAIVVFPEAPGSFAETGYFSAIEKLSRKIVLAFDSTYQGKDSFLSMGPGRKIANASLFQPVIQIDYSLPNFKLILDRIERLPIRKNKKQLIIGKFGDLSAYELLSVVQKIVDLMSVATVDDVTYILRGLFQSQISVSKIKKIIAIMVGSKYLDWVGEFGHLRCNFAKVRLLEIRDGSRNSESVIRLELAAVYQGSDPDFLSIVEQSRNVD